MNWEEAERGGEKPRGGGRGRRRHVPPRLKSPVLDDLYQDLDVGSHFSWFFWTVAFSIFYHGIILNHLQEINDIVLQ